MSLITTTKPRLIQFTHWLLPQSCFLCGDLCQQVLCEACLTDLPVSTTGRRLPIDHPCNQGQNTPLPSHIHTQAVFFYENPIDKLIIAAKFNKNLTVLNYLGDQMAQQLTITDQPEVLIPVPLHRNRLRQRGYNQSVELAKRICQKTGIPLNYSAVIRIRDTPPQSLTKFTERRNNIRETDFKIIQPPPPWQHVILVDDVITTGTTVKAVSEMLLEAGIAKVEVWCCAS